MRRLRGLRDLVHDTIDSITGLVQETHEASAQTPVAILARLPSLDEGVRTADEVRRHTATAVFDTIRTINRGVQAIGDTLEDALTRAGTAQLQDHVERALPTELAVGLNAVADGAQGALNAFVGDFLKARGNALAIELSFWHEGKPLALDAESLRGALGEVTPNLVVFVHGLGCTEAVFRPSESAEQAGLGLEYGARLKRELGMTPLYVRYNSGLHVSENGRELAARLDALVAAWPCEVQRVALVGHSMGGLVCRSAVHYGSQDNRAFVAKLSHVLCIGSPHHGAVLERAGNTLTSLLGLFDVAGTRVPAKVFNARSAGIKDLRFGYLLDEEWTGQDPDAFLTDARKDVPLAPGVIYGFIAASWFSETQHPLGAWVGDLLVGVASASGQHADQARHIPFQLGHVLHGIHHQALLTHPAVYEQLVRFLGVVEHPA